MYSGEYDVCDVTLHECISTQDKLEKYAWREQWESNRFVSKRTLKIRDSMFQHTNMDIEKLTCP
jgi:hypothetical protein